VKKGDLLAKIDPEIYISNFERMEASLKMQKANLANSRARLAQVKAQFINAEENYKRNKQLWEQEVISPADFDGIKSNYEVAKSEVVAAEENVKAAKYNIGSAQASLKEARENLERTTITSPTDGTVSRLSVEKGERVTGASQFSSGTEIMRIANLTTMEVNVEVNENDIVRVNYNDTCIIEVDAYLDTEFKGIVTEIATSANIVGVSADQVTNFEVKIRILQDSYKDMMESGTIVNSPFRPGMSATVDIQTETGIDILTVPIQAVTTRTDTASTDSHDIKDGEETEEETAEKTEEDTDKDEAFEVVFLYSDGKASLQMVETGIQDSKYIQIISGLSEEQEIIVGPYRAISKKLKNNSDVKKVEKKELFTRED